jgi:hypothetical protein
MSLDLKPTINISKGLSMNNLAKAHDCKQLNDKGFEDLELSEPLGVSSVNSTGEALARKLIDCIPNK